jgi:hypothetical protein
MFLKHEYTIIIEILDSFIYIYIYIYHDFELFKFNIWFSFHIKDVTRREFAKQLFHWIYVMEESLWDLIMISSL